MNLLMNQLPTFSPSPLLGVVVLLAVPKQLRWVRAAGMLATLPHCFWRS